MHSIKWLSEIKYNLATDNNKALFIKLWPQLSYGNINSSLTFTLSESFEKKMKQRTDREKVPLSL
jgi:hypothetical protein